MKEDTKAENGFLGDLKTHIQKNIHTEKGGGGEDLPKRKQSLERESTGTKWQMPKTNKILWRIQHTKLRDTTDGVEENRELAWNSSRYKSSWTLVR